MIKSVAKFAALWLLSASGCTAASCQVGKVHLAVSSAIEKERPSGSVSGQVFREIDDPHTGDRWLLVRPSSQFGGPGRLVRVADHAGGYRPTAKSGLLPDGLDAQLIKLPIIHSGDRLIVEESTAKVSARLEAVALSIAYAGDPLRVRLLIGGKIVAAMALEPGRAAFVSKMEVQP